MAFRKAAEPTNGVLYTTGAAHQTFYVLRHSEQSYVAMADQARFPPAQAFIERFLVSRSDATTPRTSGRRWPEMTLSSGWYATESPTMR
jgi:hypothetical protein